VVLEKGGALEAQAIVVATDEPQARKLLKKEVGSGGRRWMDQYTLVGLCDSCAWCFLWATPDIVIQLDGRHQQGLVAWQGAVKGRRSTASTTIKFGFRVQSCFRLVNRNLAAHQGSPHRWLVVWQGAVEGRGSTCLYYALKGPPPLTDPLLVLNGEGTTDDKPVNNIVSAVDIWAWHVRGGDVMDSVRDVCGQSQSGKASRFSSFCKLGIRVFALPDLHHWRDYPESTQCSEPFPCCQVFLDRIAPSYAPEGQSLASVTVVGIPKANDAALDGLVRGT
jgi:hypothetical protein